MMISDSYSYSDDKVGSFSPTFLLLLVLFFFLQLLSLNIIKGVGLTAGYSQRLYEDSVQSN